MKTSYLLLTVLFSLTSCVYSPQSPQQFLGAARREMAETFEASNAKVLAWEHLIDSIYKLADTNHIASLAAIDALLAHDTALSGKKFSDLHFIKGDIYCRLDSAEKSLDEFARAGQVYDVNAARILAARAGALLKLRRYNDALADLNTAAELNAAYLWNLGNYYEIIGNRDSAIACYTQLYTRDTVSYKFCLDRVNDLKNPKTAPLKELIYRDRERKMLLLELN